MDNREIVSEKRLQYLSNQITHQQYYLWLAEFIGATRKSFGIIRDHSNLQEWDNLDPIFRNLAYTKLLPWSLSDTVCTAKALYYEDQATK